MIVVGPAWPTPESTTPRRHSADIASKDCQLGVKLIYRERS